MVALAAGLAGLIAVVLLLWWLLVKTEGVYLGRGAVIGLYNVYARRYDRIKRFVPKHESLYLARPILKRVPGTRAPLVLDVATGTGRVPLALLDQPEFQGRVIGLDLSRRMLTVAAEKLAAHRTRSLLMHHAAETLPFPDDTFDLVTSLEALEFLMDQRTVLREMVRVLRPGGLLVVTNRQGRDARLMPGHIIPHERFERLLRDEIGLRHVYIQPWQVDYRLVWGIKRGESLPTGPRPLEEIWRCPCCGALRMGAHGEGWRCDACGAAVPQVGGVIEVERCRCRSGVSRLGRAGRREYH